MIPKEVLQHIRRIQIRTSRRVDDVLAGQYHSAFRGRGIEFEEVRPYSVGDDVRTIDWNVTARTGEPFIKLFREERELTVHLLVDLSASQAFGTQRQSKRELVSEVGATLAFSAIKNNDNVALTLFTDRVEKVVPPGKGSRHVLRVIRELLYCQPVGRGTDLRLALERLNHTARRRSVVFFVSDFQDSGYEQALRVASRKHDVIPVVVADRREQTMPNVGLITLVDSESGKRVTLDTASEPHRRRLADAVRQSAARRDQLFKKLKLDPLLIFTGQDFVGPLRRFFHRRESKR